MFRHTSLARVEIGLLLDMLAETQLWLDVPPSLRELGTSCCCELMSLNHELWSETRQQNKADEVPYRTWLCRSMGISIGAKTNESEACCMRPQPAQAEHLGHLAKAEQQPFQTEAISPACPCRPPPRFLAIMRTSAVIPAVSRASLASGRLNNPHCLPQRNHLCCLQSHIQQAVRVVTASPRLLPLALIQITKSMRP